jgi:hypothetical protein
MQSSPQVTESSLDRMQAALPGPLKRVPVQAVMAGIGLTLLTASSITLALVRGDAPIAALEADEVAASPDGGTPPPGARPSAVASAGTARPAAGPTRLSAAELDAARIGGPQALAALAQRYPEEPSVLQALCSAQVHDTKDFLGAVRVLRHLIEIAPERAADKDVQTLVIDVANGPADAAEEVFDLLKSKMGSHGPDLLYELITAATGKYAKEHAASALGDPAVQKQASKALLIADELRIKLPCARKPLISRAAADGDQRSLPWLRQILPAKTCKGAGGIVGLFRGSDCRPLECYLPSERTGVANAIEAIEKRDKK